MTKIASLSDLEPIITGLQNQLSQLQTTVNAMGAPPSMQNGVLASGDGLLSAASVDGSTGDITVTFSTAADPIYVLNTQGVLAPVVFIGQTTVLSPPVLPTSAHTLCLGVELSPGGALSLVCGTAASGNLAIGSLTSPAITAGLLRLADVALANVSGTYELGFTTSLSQGTNWRDRRSWANGANAFTKYTGGNITLTGATGPAILNSALQLRVECSGALMEFELIALVGGAAGTTNFGFRMDGSTLDGLQDGEAWQFSGTAEYATFRYYYAPAAGSHLFVPTYLETAGAGATVFATSADPIEFRIREVLAATGNNGSS